MYSRGFRGIFFFHYISDKKGAGTAGVLCTNECDSIYAPVLLIHDILVGIRIRGSMPLTNGSGSCYFPHWPSRANKKLFFSKFSCFFLFFEGIFTSFFKDKKSKRSHKTVGIKVLLTFIAWWYKDPDPGGPKTYGSGTLICIPCEWIYS